MVRKPFPSNARLRIAIVLGIPAAMALAGGVLAALLGEGPNGPGSHHIAPLAAVAVAAAVSLALLAWIAGRIGMGLASLEASLRAMAEGEPERAPGMPGDDAMFGEVARTAGLVAERIRTDAIKLETVVARRTSELSGAYNELQKRNESIRRDLVMAQRVQKRILPNIDAMQARREVRFAGYYASMDDLGGDIYDIIRAGKNAYGLLMADVSGHGTPAALVTSMVKVAFQTRVGWNARTDEVCASVNEELLKVLSDSDQYVTAFFGILNLEDGVFEYTNAGHHPARLVRAEGSVEELDSDGRFLGMFENAPFGRKTVALRPGDRILEYTDGIIEARNLLGEEFGYGRFNEWAAGLAGIDAKAVVSGLVASLDAFSMGAPKHDDQAVLCAEFRERAPRDKPAR